MSTIPQALLDRLAAGQTLPEQLPEDPFPTFVSWFNAAVAARRVPNPSAMTLATIEPDGSPSARIVLCRGIVPSPGHVVFFTNYRGAKGRALAANPRASLVFHFDHDDRQVRIIGPVTKSPDAESDAYFSSRPWESRLSAWASEQSEPIPSRPALLSRLGEVMARLGVSAEECLTKGDAVRIPRPPHWGGFRVHAQSVELWLGGPGRLHDRARWTRTLTPDGSGSFVPGPWSSTRLSP